MNKIFKITTAILAAGLLATAVGCSTGGGGCAGCNKNVVDLALTNSNWYTGTSYKGIQPTFIEGNDNFSKEEIVYDVTFDGSSANNKFYSVEYKDGTFKTEFYARTYNWNGAGIPNDYKSDAVETVYYYRTELNISVRYKLTDGGATSEWMNDCVINESYFRATGSNLQPVYSKQVIHSSSPNTDRPTTLNSTASKKDKPAYTVVDVEYENYYNKDCTEILSIKKQDGQSKNTVYKAKKLKHTLFDNSALYIVARSMKLSANLSQSISLFSAAAGGISDYSIIGYSRALADEERTNATTLMESAGLYVKGEDDKGINTVALSLNFAGGKLAGAGQTAWYAAIDNYDNNVSRATLIKLSVPVYFGLGTLNYNIKSINSTLWNQ